MSTVPIEGPLSGPLPEALPDAEPGCTPRRRVRHEARDAVAVMAFSAASSTLLAGLLVLAVRIGG